MSQETVLVQHTLSRFSDSGRLVLTSRMEDDCMVDFFSGDARNISFIPALKAISECGSGTLTLTGDSYENSATSNYFVRLICSHRARDAWHKFVPEEHFNCAQYEDGILSHHQALIY